MLWDPHISGIYQLHRHMEGCPKVDMPKLVTYLDQAPIFDWYVVRCG